MAVAEKDWIRRWLRIGGAVEPGSREIPITKRNRPDKARGENMILKDDNGGTGEGDVVLVTMDNQPTFFARIEEITADVKPEWFQVKMLVLQIPLMVITWILREPYINGEEFTMGGRPIRMTKVIAPEEPEREADEDPADEQAAPESSSRPSPSPAKVVSLADRRRKNSP